MGNKPSRAAKQKGTQQNATAPKGAQAQAANNPPAAPSKGANSPPKEKRGSRQRRGKTGTSVTGMLTDILKDYDIEKKELGHGHYGVVRVGTDKKTTQKVAIKSIPKAKVNRPEILRREIEILQSLDHPNIIKLFKVYEDNRSLHIVTELCTGGELFDRIIAKGHYSEADAAHLIRTLTSAVSHCHSKGICHRDLKPENFLFATKDEDADVKVIDFGLSRIYDDVEVAMTTRVGTPYYIAPEILGRNYDNSCDMWSIGVITYILICGYPPFYGEADAEIFAAVRSGQYDYDSEEWEGVSDEAKNFIDSLLQLDPSKRLTAEQSLKHPWLTGSAPDENRSDSIMSRLKKFNGENKLKQAALGLIANQLTGEEIEELRQVFKKIDADGNGVITLDELNAAADEFGDGFLNEDIEQILRGIDVDGNGTIDYQEFIAASMKKNTALKEQHIVNAFSEFASEGKDVITKEDLVRFMGSEHHAEEILKEVDTNNDGVISLEEFREMMKEKNLDAEGQPTAAEKAAATDAIFDM